MSPRARRSPLFWLRIAAFAWSLLALAPRALEAQEASKPTVEALAKQIAERGDLVDVDVVHALAAHASTEALRELVAAYDSFQTLYMRRTAIGAFVRFADTPAEADALAKLRELALAGDSRELAESAVGALAALRASGRAALREVVSRAPLADVRELALREHTAAAEAADAAWYRELWKPREPDAQMKGAKSGAKPRGGATAAPAKDAKAAQPAPEDAQSAEREPTPRMREIAFEALAPRFSVDELAAALTDASPEIRSAALSRLEDRDATRATTLAEARYSDASESAVVRATAAAVIARQQGRAALARFVEDGGKAGVSRRLSDALVALVASKLDAELEKQLARMLGKGSHAARVFALRVLARGSEHKHDAAIAKELDEQEEEIALAATDALAARGANTEAPALRKALERAQDGSVRAALIEALSKLLRDDPAWRKQLAAYTDDADLDVRNAAATELGRGGTEADLRVLAKLLDHPTWSTRLAAVRGLEALRSEAVLPPLIERLARESGRLTTDIAATLQRLTGRSFGVYADLWRRWWDALPSDWRMPGASGVARTSAGVGAVREPGGTRVANFFGARVTSQRVAFVVDVSQSMAEPAEDGKPRFEHAKARLETAVSALAPDVQFNLIAFSGVVGGWRARLSGAAKGEKPARDDRPLLEQAKVWIEKLKLGPGTNLYGALQVAFSDPDVDTLYVLTDGEPTQGALIDPSAIRARVASWNRHRGVVIHTIAFGGTFPILEWLAEDSGGSYRYIP